MCRILKAFWLWFAVLIILGITSYLKIQNFLNWNDFITIIALIMGPISAAYLSLQIEPRFRIKEEGRKRQLDIFRTLMATRANALSNEHVDALNKISIDFYNNSEVISAFQKHINFLSQPTNNWGDPQTYTELAAYLTNLLQKIATSLGYTFDVHAIQYDCYRPTVHNYVQQEQIKLLKLLVGLLENQSAVNINLIKKDH